MNTAVYNNLLSNFEPKYTTKYAHESSELRSVVKQIRRQAETSPVYLLNFTDKKQSYVLGVKEAAMKMKESLNVLADDSPDSLFAKRKAQSTDLNQVEAELVGGDNDQLPSVFSIRVKQLANAQVNKGKEYYDTGKGLEAGSYQFKVTVNDVGYDFQYNIRKDANHREVIQGLSSFITKAKIGLEATPYSTEGGKIGMRIEALTLGTPNGYESFSLQDKTTDSAGRGIVSFYGLNKMSVAPKNAVFDLNGTEKSSMANDFTLGRTVKVTLRNISESEATVNYRPDSELILQGVGAFTANYNELVGHNLAYQETTGSASKLLRELKGLVAPFQNEMESYGLVFNEEGYLGIDFSLATEAIENGEMRELFSINSPFAMRLAAKSDIVKINPMEYIDKQIVSYPNFSKPPRGFAYISSLYSGLLFNSYF